MPLEQYLSYQRRSPATETENATEVCFIGNDSDDRQSKDNVH